MKKSRKADGKRIDGKRSRAARLASFPRTRIAIAKLLTKKDDVGLTKSEERRLEQMRRNLYGE